MKKGFTIAFVCAIFINFGIYAQLPWERITPTPQEHTLNWIQKIPGTQKLIAVGEGSTVMLSDDAGLSWEIILNPAGMDNEYMCYGTYFINESTGFIYGGKKTILKTIDGGYHWELKYDGQSMYNTSAVRDMDFSSEMRGYAIGNDGVFLETSDGGETWTDVGMSVDFTLKQIEFFTPLNGYITGTDTTSMLKTLDGGLNWELVPVFSGLKGKYTNNLTFINDQVGFMTCSVGIQNTEYMIYKTADAGQIWRQVFSAYSHPDIRLDFLDTVHGIAGYIAPAYLSKFLITNDGGDTWVESPHQYIPWYSTNSLCYFSLEKIITIGAKGRIYTSSDQGVSWVKESSNIFNGHIYDVQFTSPLVGYCRSALMEGGLWHELISKTMNGGQSWQIIAGSFDYSCGAMHFLNDLIGFYTAYDVMGMKLFKTVDGGVNWTETQSSLDIVPMIIRFADESNGILCSDFNIYRTDDSGATWQVITDPDLFTNYTSDIVYRTANKVFLCGEDWSGIGIVTSEDGGISWDKIPIDDYNNGYDICFANDNLAFIASDNSIFKSADGGQTWSKCIVNTVHEIKFKKISFPTPDIGYAVGHGLYENLFKTTDGGDHWEPVNSGTTTNINSLHFFDELHGLVFGEWGLEMRTTTGGIVTVEDPIELSNHSQVEIYPNPSSGMIHIDLATHSEEQNSKIVITNILGAKVKSIELKNSVSSLDLNCSAFDSGIYIFQYYEGNSLKNSRKVVLVK